MDKGRNYTRRDEEYIYERVKEMTVEQVSRNEQLSPAKIENIFRRIASQKKDWGDPQRLSLDEFSRQLVWVLLMNENIDFDVGVFAENRVSDTGARCQFL